MFLKGSSRLGNFFVSINNAIIFCELLGCKKLIIEKNNIIFINHTIFYQKYNFTIKPNQEIGNCSENNCIILNNWFFFHLDFKYIGKINRLYILYLS